MGNGSVDFVELSGDVLTGLKTRAIAAIQALDHYEANPHESVDVKYNPVRPPQDLFNETVLDMFKDKEFLAALAPSHGQRRDKNATKSFQIHEHIDTRGMKADLEANRLGAADAQELIGSMKVGKLRSALKLFVWSVDAMSNRPIMRMTKRQLWQSLSLTDKIEGVCLLLIWQAETQLAGILEAVQYEQMAKYVGAANLVGDPDDVQKRVREIAAADDALRAKFLEEYPRAIFGAFIEWAENDLPLMIGRFALEAGLDENAEELYSWFRQGLSVSGNSAASLWLGQSLSAEYGNNQGNRAAGLKTEAVPELLIAISETEGADQIEQRRAEWVSGIVNSKGDQHTDKDRLFKSQFRNMRSKVATSVTKRLESSRNRMRRNSKNIQVLELDADPAFEAIAAPNADPSEVFELSNQNAEWERKVQDNLTVEQRRVWGFMRQGYTDTDIARHTGKAVGTVNAHQAEIRKRLRKIGPPPKIG